MSEPADDTAVERQTLRKVAWRILPLVALGYAVSYMDRVNISFAAERMNAELGFSAAVYGLGAGLFFLSYALFEVPSNMILARVGARAWIARIMFTWGLISAGMMFVATPAQFYAARFLLGLAEAGFFPGVVYYLSQWFPAAHTARAIGRFYVAVPLVSVVMGAAAGALLSMHGILGLSGWQWLFLIEGLPAVVLSLAILVWLPDRPATVPWLDAAEKAWLEARLAADAAARGVAEHGFWRALTNPVVLTLGAANFLMLGSFNAFNFSVPQLLNETTRWGATRVGWLIAAASLLGAVAMLVNTWHSDRTGERYRHAAFPLFAGAAGFAVIALTEAPGVVVAAYVFTIAATFAFTPTLWTVSHALLPARSSAVSVAAINTIGQTGSFVAPFAWGLARDATGSFRLGEAALPFCFAASGALILLLGWRAGRAATAQFRVVNPS